MLRKTIPFFIIISASLLLIASLTLFTKAAPQPVNTSEQLQAQKQFVISYIESAKDVNAQEAFDELLIDFGGTEDVVPAIYEIAEKYRQFAKYKPAIDAHRYILDNFPDSEQAILAQRSVAVCSIALGNIDTAEIETQNLINNYIDDTNIAQAVFEIADAYYWFGKNAEAQQLYQQVIDSWPTAQHAMWSQMGLAISYIADGNDLAAQEATDKLVINYPDNEKLPEALFYIAGRYGWDKKYEQAQNLYYYIVEQFPETDWAANSEFESAKNDVYILLDAKDEPNTLSEIDDFIANFAERQNTPAAVYDFAARYDWMNKHEPNELTKAILNKLINSFLPSQLARRAQVNLLRMDLLDIVLSDGDANEVMAGVEQIVTDYNDIPESAQDLLIIAERFSGKGWEGRMAGDEEKAVHNWQKAVEIREKLIKHLPKSSYLAQAHYTTGVVLAQNLHEYEQGIEYFKKAVGNWPEYRYTLDALYSIGSYSEKLKRQKNTEDPNLDTQIEEAYQAVIEKYPEHECAELACKKLGWHYFKKGQWSDSAQYYEMFLERSPDRLDKAVNPLGLSYEYMGEKDLAIQIYRQFLSITDPADSRLDTIKNRIERLEGTN